MLVSALFGSRLPRGNMVQYVLMDKDFRQDKFLETFAAEFTPHRERLLLLAKLNLNPILSKRFSPEDVVSATYEECMKRPRYFTTHLDVPFYFKLREILLQTITDLERRHLQASARDAYKEVEVRDDGEESECTRALNWGVFAAEITSPASRVDRSERHQLLRAALKTLSPNDQQILILRHFDNLGNSDCAEILGIEEKAASIRYVRALKRLKERLLELSCFKQEGGQKK